MFLLPLWHSRALPNLFSITIQRTHAFKSTKYLQKQGIDDSDVSKLMDIFTKNDTYDFEKFPKTSTRKKHFKIDEEGRQEMSDIVREIAALERAEGKAEGFAEGRTKGRSEGRTEGKMLNLIELAYTKINNGQSVSEISEDLLADTSLISLIYKFVTASKASGAKISPEEIYQKIKEKESIE